ncbi:putative flavoprotein [Cokeromyces recurvatus]|uniref:putative flavoprotein n=1 Tax=Cokeromyces recurvatus TaxID=90255 RepID=UPI0022206A1C|nr:putative flavoprotein [Cokeromyces recurvatus]KAI7899854.1 putative flavoprotein [Cokeromyces recurvatus]
MKHPTVAIIGSGFSGMATAIKLKKELNIEADIFESTSEIGGTWNYNTYPGCACDIPSHLYSFSFELNPNWSQQYSSQKEIHQYMLQVAKKHRLKEQTQFETQVVRASWIESKKQWKLELKSFHNETNQIKYYDIVFSGIGSIRVPNIPKEFSTFEGKIIHSSHWDSSYDFSNKKVAVIGSGTSSVQIVPSLQKQVSHLYNYIRTPTWITPRNQFYYPDYVKWLFGVFPFLMYLYRAYQFFIRELRFSIWGNANSQLAKRNRARLEKEMSHILLSRGRPDLISKLIPNVAPGCKRFGVSDNYLQSLCEDNVTVHCSSIEKVEGKTIITSDGSRAEVDVLCLATGFDVNGFLGDLQVYGRNGICLNKLWEEMPSKTYKTINVHGFPNLFLLLGPGSGLGHNSVVTMIECQVDYSIRIIKHMMKNNIVSLDPKKEAQDRFYSKLQHDFKGTTWVTGCQSWYIGRTGDIQFLWPKTVTSYYLTLKKNVFDDYIQTY